MKIDMVAVVITAILAVFAGAWYCLQIVNGAVAPALATWLIFGIASTLSLVSYLKTPRTNNSFFANIANRLDPVATWVVVAFILFSSKSDKSLHAFDYVCLAFAAIVVGIWAMSGSAKIANVLAQSIIFAGYFPTYAKMIGERRNTESFVMWGLNLAIVSLFLIPPIRHRDKLGILYAGRGVVGVAGTLLIMLYFEFHGLH